MNDPLFWLRALFLALLTVLAVTDALKKRVPLRLVLAALGVSAAGLWDSPAEKVLPVFLTGAFAVFSFLSPKLKDQIGPADSLMILAVSLAFPAGVFFRGLVFTGIGVGVFAFVLYRKTKEKKRELPFLPFLAGGLYASLLGELICRILS